jgi:hypothetical protein
LSKVNSASRRRMINTSSIKFFPVPLFYQPTQQFIGTLCLPLHSNAELIMDSISLREGDGPGRTSSIISGLWKKIDVVSLRTIPCRVTSQHERKSSLKLMRYSSNALRPSSVKVSKGRLEDVVLVKVGFIVTEVSSLHA